MITLRVITEKGSCCPLTALCSSEEHAMEVFRVWLSGLEVKRRPVEFRVEVIPVDGRY